MNHNSKTIMDPEHTSRHDTMILVCPSYKNKNLKLEVDNVRSWGRIPNFVYFVVEVTLKTGDMKGSTRVSDQVNSKWQPWVKQQSQ